MVPAPVSRGARDYEDTLYSTISTFKGNWEPLQARVRAADWIDHDSSPHGLHVFKEKNKKG